MSFSSYAVSIPRGWTMSHPSAGANPWRWFKRRHPALARVLREQTGRAGSEPGNGQAGTLQCWWETAGEDDIFREKTPRIFSGTGLLFRLFIMMTAARSRAVALSLSRYLPISCRSPEQPARSRLCSEDPQGWLGVNGLSTRGTISGTSRSIRRISMIRLDAARDDRIVSLVVRLRDLKKHLARAKTPEECRSLQEKTERPTGKSIRPRTNCSD